MVWVVSAVLNWTDWPELDWAKPQRKDAADGTDPDGNGRVNMQMETV